MLLILEVAVARFCSIYQGGSEATIPSSAFSASYCYETAGLTSFSCFHTLLVLFILILFEVSWEEN